MSQPFEAGDLVEALIEAEPAVAMRRVLTEDADAVRRSRAAEALGEFLDVKGLPALEQAAMADQATEVRASRTEGVV